MKTNIKEITLVPVLLFALFLQSCSHKFLDEVPPARLSNDNVLSSKSGFDNYINSLHYAAREELSATDLLFYFDNYTGTDICTSGQLSVQQFVNYEAYLTPFTNASSIYWNWAYGTILPRANAVIINAERKDLADIWASEKEKNEYIAEARFFRGYTYNILATLYGGVCIADTIYSTPKIDFKRATREEVYRFAIEDLEFALKWLPEVSEAPGKQGRIFKGAAAHLLTELYISVKEYDKAIQVASDLIDSKQYHLMNERFGVNKDQPGDVFSDLFIQGNQNRTSGNLEAIYVWQFEEFTQGGSGTISRGNHLVRGWLPFMVQLQDPDGKLGISLNDSIGRGVAIIRPNSYYLYDIWGADFHTDMRNSRYNMRREYYYNNPSSAYFGQKIEPRTTQIDTMQRLFPTTRKVEGKPWQGDLQSGGTGKDFIVYRLAETYLLRAEAYHRADDNINAAADINKLRERANASAVTAGDITIDFILDERARELIAEEPRRRTLMRMGKLVERVKKYNMKPETRNSIAEKHELYPIPQSAIDANFGNKLEQNPGYN